VRDVDLVALAAAGDADAAAQLFVTYRRFVLTQAYRAGVAADVCDDVVQTVFVWLLTGRWRVDERYVAAGVPGNLKPFLKSITRYVAGTLRALSSLPRDDGSSDVDADLQVFQRPGLSLNPEQLALRHERLRLLVAAIRRLPKGYRRVAVLRYVHELSGPDIAARVGVQANTIPGYLHVIRARLRQDLVGVYRVPSPDPSGRTRGGHRRMASTVEASCR
jgi:RNA polymerase sigma-70 factor (ECF subfamily)